mmetsp:Transcript_16636/g.36175  ORF Transcript_16636/g.36175 Transcript_16636/m.36175 type:complete len:220 (+) Transcript_16636:404-1063(+)
MVLVSRTMIIRLSTTITKRLTIQGTSILQWFMRPLLLRLPRSTTNGPLLGRVQQWVRRHILKRPGSEEVASRTGSLRRRMVTRRRRIRARRRSFRLRRRAKLRMIVLRMANRARRNPLRKQIARRKIAGAEHGRRRMLRKRRSVERRRKGRKRAKTRSSQWLLVLKNARLTRRFLLHTLLRSTWRGSSKPRRRIRTLRLCSQCTCRNIIRRLRLPRFSR